MNVFARGRSFLMDRSIESLPIWQRPAFRAMRVVYAVGRDIAEGQLSLRAMSLVYTTLITLVPLLAISFSVLKGFGVHNQVEPLLLAALEPLGQEQAREATKTIIKFVDNIKVGVLGAVGLGLLIYSVIALMQKIERSFNYIWRVSRERTFAERFSDYLSILLVGPLLIFSSAGLTASVKSNTYVEYISSFTLLTPIFDFMALAIPYVIMAAAFAFLYVFIPNTKVRISAALIAGLFTALIWKFLGYLFSVFVAGSASYVAIYAAFASIIIFMIWIYLGWLVMLVGSSIAFYIQYPKYIRVSRGPVMLSNRVREKIALAILYLIGKSHYEDGKKWDADSLAHALDVPIMATESVLDDLREMGILALTKEEPIHVLPATPFDATSIQDVLNAVRSCRERKNISYFRIKAEKQIETTLQQYDTALEEKFGAKTVKDMVTG